MDIRRLTGESRSSPKRKSPAFHRTVFGRPGNAARKAEGNETRP
jgi:hypothetical protein